MTRDEFLHRLKKISTIEAYIKDSKRKTEILEDKLRNEVNQLLEDIYLNWNEYGIYATAIGAASPAGAGLSAPDTTPHNQPH